MAGSPSDNQRQALLDFLAKCDQAFTPYAPIDLPEFFAGRIDVVRRIDDEISAPGRHVALFGERGTGKTSLAKLAYFFLRRKEEETHFVSCTKSSTFDTIFADVLLSAGVETTLEGVEAESQRHGGLNLPGTLPGLSFGGIRRVKSTYKRVSAGARLTTRFLEEHLGAQDGLVIIDEYDRVQDSETHVRTAELIKAFSDAKAPMKIILVGVADTLGQLIGEHASLSRSLAQIRLDRMSDAELEDIIARGCKHLSVKINDAVRRRMIGLADGFPYFVHLLCRHSCRQAAERWLASPPTGVVSKDDYLLGLQDALENSKHSLEEQYERAIVTTRRRTAMFALLLGAIAISPERDVQVQEIAKNLSLLTGEPLRPPSTFSWHLGELVDEGRGRVLSKVRDGFYKVSNPLLRPYIRFRLEQYNWIDRGGQLVFPFMEPRGSDAPATDSKSVKR